MKNISVETPKKLNNSTKNQPETPHKIAGNQPETGISIVEYSKSKEEESKEKVEIPAEFNFYSPPPANKNQNLIPVLEKIIKLFPKNKRPKNEKEYTKWLENLNQLLKQLAYQELENIIIYSLRDDFWQTHINNLEFFLKISPSAQIPYWKKLKHIATINSLN